MSFNYIKSLADTAELHGYVVFVYPRKKMVAINGGRQKPFKEAHSDLLSLANDHKLNDYGVCEQCGSDPSRD